MRASEAALILRAGRQSKLGKALRHPKLWNNQQVPAKEYDDLIETLLKAAEGHCQVDELSTIVGYPDSMITTSKSIYRGYRFPAAVIEHAVWLYFPLSPELAHGRGPARGARGRRQL